MFTQFFPFHAKLKFNNNCSKFSYLLRLQIHNKNKQKFKRLIMIMIIVNCLRYMKQLHVRHTSAGRLRPYSRHHVRGVNLTVARWLGRVTPVFPLNSNYYFVYTNCVLTRFVTKKREDLTQKCGAGPGQLMTDNQLVFSKKFDRKPLKILLVKDCKREMYFYSIG